MAVMKYKDTDGTWKELPGAMVNVGGASGAELKIDVITRATSTTFDLSKYANCNRFFLIYSAGNGTDLKKYIYDSSKTTGYLYSLDGTSSGLTNDSYGSGITEFVTDGYSNASEAKAIFSAVYDDGSSLGDGGSQEYAQGDTVENNILTTQFAQVGQSAIVIYAE